MALYWNLGMFTRDLAAARACMTYFEAKRLVVQGIEVPLEITHREVPGGFVVGVWPRGMSHASPRGDDRRLTTDEVRAAIGDVFDEWLREAPPFTAAFFGGEAFDYFLDGVTELTEPMDGLFCDEEMFEAFGRPASAQSIGDHRYAWPRTAVP